MHPITNVNRGRARERGYAIIAPMITKRQLGYLFIAIGLLVITGSFTANVIGGRDAGFGPFQQLGLAGGVVIIVMAAPLIRLGNRPA